MRYKPDLRHGLELLYLLVLKDLKVRYKSSVLGYLWALTNPFMFAFVYWIAFKFVMRVEMENYSLFLISGLFPWLWLSSGITHATRIYQTNSSLIKRIKLNRAVLPLSAVVQEMVHFFFALPVVVGFLWFAGGESLRWSWLWQIPLLTAVQLLFMYPAALVLAVANVFAHDVEYLVGVGFSVLFFATPMVYPLKMVPEEYRPYFEASPLHALIDNWRATLLAGTIQPGYLLYCIGCGLAFSAIAFLVYRKFMHRIGELL